ncbi:MAG: hypothetical protein KGL39_48940 [Patescibacteria group bacterium]|nr:hypothetical protein [Patescibacteria group bacterium]
MTPYINPSNIMFAIGVIGAMFGVYHYFKNPQIKLDKNESLMQQQIVQFGKDLANLRDNHVHTLDEKLDATIKGMNELAIRVERLSTIIEERIPKRVV